MWCLQNKESWQPQKERAASTRARGTASHGQSQAQTTPACQPPVAAPLAAACTQQRKHFPPSHLPLTHDRKHSVNTEQPWVDRWGKSMQDILTSSLEFRILSSLRVQDLPGLSMVSYDPILFHTTTLAARQWTAQPSASLRQKSSWFCLLLRSSLDQLRTLYSSWRSFATWHWSLVLQHLPRLEESLTMVPTYELFVYCTMDGYLRHKDLLPLLSSVLITSTYGDVSPTPICSSSWLLRFFSAGWGRMYNGSDSLRKRQDGQDRKMDEDWIRSGKDQSKKARTGKEKEDSWEEYCCLGVGHVFQITRRLKGKKW